MNFSGSSNSNRNQRSRLTEDLGSNSQLNFLSNLGAEQPSFVQNNTTIQSHLNKTLSKLIDRFDVATENQTFQDTQRQKDRLIEKYNAIINRQKESSIVQDNNQVINSIKDELLQDSRGSEKAIRFGHLCNKLNSKKRPNNKWSIFYLMSLLSDIPSTNPFIDLSDSIMSPSLQQRGLQNIDSSTGYLQPPAARPLDPHQADSPRNIRRRLDVDTLPQPNRNNDVDMDNEPPAVQLARAREAQKDKHHNSTYNDSIYVSESDLLRDLIFLFQGIDGQYIKYDPHSGDHIFIPGIDLSKPTELMVFKLAEIGWLYSKIRDFIDTHMNQMPAATATTGLVGQSLCAALQHELTAYYKFIANLEAQIEKQIASHNNSNNRDEEGSVNGGNNFNGQSLTLKRLQVWTLDCAQKLRLMSVLVDVCQDQKGGSLVSSIHNYTKHGDPFIKRYLKDMLQVISKPFYEMLERWIYEGELEDPYGEFFVACDTTVTTEDNLWKSKYSIREEMLPSFLSKDLAQKIFSIGRSLNFIRYSCHDGALVDQYFTEQSRVTRGRQNFKYGDTQEMEKSIDKAYLETSKALLDLLKSKYKLMDHLKALKRYLLLGQGDFIQYLMDILGENLSKPASTLFRHNLTGILETAVRASNAQYDDSEIMNRLDVRLLEIQKDDLGWDVFTLDYHVDAPVNTVLSPDAMLQYLQIFNFLWRLKRVEYTLSASWRQWGNASREFSNVPDLHQDLLDAQLTIQRMIHFIYQLQHYVLFEVLECSWDKLETFIENRSIDLDSIIEAHSKYLSEITEKGFLSGPKEKALSGRLNNLFDCILKYKTILDNLYHCASAESTRVSNGRRERGDGASGGDSSRIARIRLYHQKEKDSFARQVLQFLTVLKSYHDEDLRSLSTRLDYNDYYSSLSASDVAAAVVAVDNENSSTSGSSR